MDVFLFFKALSDAAAVLKLWRKRGRFFAVSIARPSRRVELFYKFVRTEFYGLLRSYFYFTVEEGSLLKTSSVLIRTKQGYFKLSFATDQYCRKITMKGRQIITSKNTPKP